MKLSLILPIRNGGRFIDSSLAAVQKIAGLDDEIIVIDDGSTDDTLKKLSRFKRSDSRFQIISSGGLGLVETLNLGLSLASNEYAARFDIDDQYPLNRLEIQRASLGSSPVAVFSDYHCWNHDFTKSLGRIPSAVTHESTYLSLISSSRTPHPSVILSVKAAKEVGGYLSDEYLAEDLSLWLRMARVGKVISIPQTLLNYRFSSHSVTSANQLKMVLIRNQVLTRYPIPRAVFESVFENSQKIFEEYESYSDVHRRGLLLFRDLFMYQKRYRIKHSGLNKKIVNYVSSNFSEVANETIQLEYEKLLRSKSRR